MSTPLLTAIGQQNQINKEKSSQEMNFLQFLLDSLRWYNLRLFRLSGSFYFSFCSLLTHPHPHWKLTGKQDAEETSFSWICHLVDVAAFCRDPSIVAESSRRRALSAGTSTVLPLVPLSFPLPLTGQATPRMSSLGREHHLRPLELPGTQQTAKWVSLGCISSLGASSNSLFSPSERPKC